MKTTRSNESIERTENKSKRSLLESHICLSQKVKQARHQKINTQTKFNGNSSLRINSKPKQGTFENLYNSFRKKSICNYKENIEVQQAKHNSNLSSASVKISDEIKSKIRNKKYIPPEITLDLLYDANDKCIDFKSISKEQGNTITKDYSPTINMKAVKGHVMKCKKKQESAKYKSKVLTSSINKSMASLTSSVLSNRKKSMKSFTSSEKISVSTPTHKSPRINEFLKQICKKANEVEMVNTSGGQNKIK